MTFHDTLIAVIAFILGIITILSIEVWYDGRAEKTRKLQEQADYEARKSSNTFEPETEVAMDQAVALVKRVLGGTVIH